MGYETTYGYRRWGGPAPRAVFLLVHGLGARSARWEAMAGFLAQHGISSYGAELDEHSDFRDYFRQVLDLRRMAAAENPGKKIFIAGESMGALIAFLVSSSNPGLFDGLVCLSPAFANNIRFAIPEYLEMAAALLYNPAKTFSVPFNSSMCTRDIEYRKKMDSDPAEYRSSSAKLLVQIMSYQIAAAFRADPGAPVLFLLAGADKIVDNSRARKIFTGLRSDDKRLIEFPGMYHSMSVDTGKETVFSQILNWADERT